MSTKRRFGGAGLRRGIRTPSAAAAEAAAWAPSDSAAVKRWWRADLGRTMVSTKVSAWLDQVEGVSVTQGTDSMRPTVGTLGGQSALSFAGGFLRGSGFVTIANPTWITVVVLQLTGAGATQIVLDDGDSNTNNWNIYYNGGAWIGGAGSILTDPTGVTKGDIHAFAMKGASSSSEFYADDFTTPVQTGNAGTSALESMTVGANHSGAAPATCLVAEILHISGATIPSELAGYLTSRYTGLTVAS